MAIKAFEPEPNLQFYDEGTKRDMMYIYPASKSGWAGWLCYRHPDGQWVTLRKATEKDLDALSYIEWRNV